MADPQQDLTQSVPQLAPQGPPTPTSLQWMLPQAQDQQTQQQMAPSAQNPQFQPQQSPASFSAGTTAVAPLAPGANGQDPQVLQARIEANYKRMEDHMKLMDPKSPQSLQQQAVLANTPAKIKQQMLNNYFGIGTKPGDLQQTPGTATTVGTDSQGNPGLQSNLSLQQGPAKPTRNWFKTMLALVSEVGRASAAEKGGYAYEDPETRFAKQANAQYTAATTPIMNQLRYNAENFRNINNQLNADLKNQTSLLSEQDRNQVNRQKANALTLLDDVKGHLTEAQQQLYSVRAQFEPEKVAAELQELKARGGLLGAQQKQTETGVNKLGGDAAAAAYRETLSPEAQKAFDADITKYKQLGESSSIQDVNGIPTRIGAKTGRATPVQVTGGVSDTSGGAIPAPKPITANGMPVPQDWATPSQVYGARALAGTPLNNLKNIPAGYHTPQNDAVMFAPNEILKGTEQKRVDDAKNLYQGAGHFLNTLNSVNPSSFGPVSGSLNKFFQGTIPTDPKLRQLWSEGQAFALSHMGTQNIRNAPLAQKINDEINSWGTTPEEMRATIKGFTEQAGNVLRDHPGSKVEMAPLLDNDYDKIENFYHPDQHTARIMRESAAALKTRQAAQQKLTGVKP